MEVANCRVRLNKVGSDVPVYSITPAQAMLLHILHGPHNGGMTFGEEFEKITVIGTAKVDTGTGLRDRSDVEELRRLASIYGGARDKNNKPIVEIIWPDRLNPKLPATFKEIKWQDVSGTGIETAAINYATGGLAQSVVPNAK